MPRGKKKVVQAPKAEPVKVEEVKTRKSYPSREERIAMAEAQIARLEALNTERSALIAKTEAKLDERRDALARSEKALAQARQRKEHLQSIGEKTIKPRAGKTEDQKKMEELLAAIEASGKSVDEFLSQLHKA